MAFPSATITVDLVTLTPHGRRRNRMYYIADTPPDHVNHVEAIANGVKAHFAPFMAAVMSDECEIEKAEARYYGNGGGLWEAPSNSGVVEGAVALTLLGEGGGDADSLPDEVSLIVRISTSLIGRNRRGRRFFTGLPEALNDSGQVHVDFRPAAIALAGKVPEDITIEYAGDGGVSGYNTALHARHYDRKTNTLHPITKAWAIGALGSRRDRRRPLPLEPLTIGP